MSAMLPASVASMLDEAQIIRVATVNPDGAPHVAPFWFSFDGARIVISTLQNATVRNIRHDPRVAVLVDLGATGDELRNALIGGRAQACIPEEAPDAVLRGIEAIENKHADEIATPTFQAYLKREKRPPVYVEIVPQRATQWSVIE